MKKRLYELLIINEFFTRKHKLIALGDLYNNKKVF